MENRNRASVFQLHPGPDDSLLGVFTSLHDLGIPHAVTTRQGPDVYELRDCPQRAMPQVGRLLGSERVAYLTQVHEATVLQAHGPGLVGEADALFTTEPGLVLAGKSADCPIVLVADCDQGLVGFAHASWRSTVAGIVTGLIQRMVEVGACPQGMWACIAPSIGPECYEVGTEVKQAALCHIGPHAETFFSPGPRRDHFDLWQANTEALLRAGLRRDRVFCAECCTVCHNDVFPSYRAEQGDAGRFVAAIALPR